MNIKFNPDLVITFIPSLSLSLTHTRALLCVNQPTDQTRVNLMIPGTSSDLVLWFLFISYSPLTFSYLKPPICAVQRHFEGFFTTPFSWAILEDGYSWLLGIGMWSALHTPEAIPKLSLPMMVFWIIRWFRRKLPHTFLVTKKFPTQDICDFRSSRRSSVKDLYAIVNIKRNLKILNLHISQCSILATAPPESRFNVQI